MYQDNLLAGCAAVACLTASTASAQGQVSEVRDYRVPAGTLAEALTAFGAQSGLQIMFSGEAVAGKRSVGLEGRFTAIQALDRLLAGSGLIRSEPRPGVIYLRPGDARSEMRTTTQLDEIVVTGTLLRSSGDLASPVVVLDRAALERRGFGTAAEAIVDLPQNYAGSGTPVVQLANADPGANNNTYATGVNLRGLGPTSTLVLVNGRRMAGTGSRAEFSDISALPTAAIERVDVLLDGASALYGSDAVAGVVNVIMRRSFDGQETRFRAAAAQGGAEDLIVSHLAGTSWESGAAYLAYEYQTLNPLSTLDRPYTRDGDLRPYGGTDHRTHFAQPGNIVALDPATSTLGVLYAIRPGANGVADGPEDFVAGSRNLASTSRGADIVPGIERHSVYARVRQGFGDRLEINGDVRYNDRAYAVTSGPNVGLFTVRNTNPHFVSPSGAASHLVAYAFDREFGGVRLTGGSESLGLTLGGQYDFSPDWWVEAYATYAQERSDLATHNRVHSRNLNEALGNIPDDPSTPYNAAVDGYFNLFGDGAANSQALLDFIGVARSELHSLSTARSANLLVRGTLLDLPSGTVDVAFGAQFRQESLESDAFNFSSTLTPQILITPRAERSVTAVFGEARLPLVGEANARPGLRRLDLSLAVRAEDYDDFGTTTNPKVGLVWSPVEHLGVRGSWGTSFHAPALPLLFGSTTVTGLSLADGNGSGVLSLLLAGGNGELEPETSETLTLGLDYRPSAGRTFSLNFFDTRFEDRIAQPVTENINGVLTDPGLSSFVTYIDPTTSAADLALITSYTTAPGFPSLYPPSAFRAVVDSRWRNTGKVRVRGVDVAAGYDWTMGGGRLALDASASWILDYESQPTPTAPVRQVAGLIGYPVKLRARTGATWSREAWTIGASWNHIDSYKDRLGARIDAWNTVDAQIGWTPSRGRAEGLRLTLTVQNLFDADPPFYDSPMGYGFDAGQASLLGRVVALQATRRW